MARLVSYKVKDDNRYSTFKNDNRWNSNENLTIQNQFQFVTKNNTKTSENKCSSTSCKNNNNSNSDQKLVCQCECWIKCWEFLCCRHYCCGSESNNSKNKDEYDGDEIEKNFSQYTNEFQLQEIDDRELASSENFVVVVPVEEKKKKSVWNWNDSLRSNSDKFLETLECDLDDRSLKRRYKHRPIRFPTTHFLRRGTIYCEILCLMKCQILCCINIIFIIIIIITIIHLVTIVTIRCLSSFTGSI